MARTTSPKTPVSAFELSLAKTVSQASFPAFSAPKRFIGDLYAGYTRSLTDRGRWYLAFVAHRFRRQYQLTAEQGKWVNEWLMWNCAQQACAAAASSTNAPSADGADSGARDGNGSAASGIGTTESPCLRPALTPAEQQYESQRLLWDACSNGNGEHQDSTENASEVLRDSSNS